MLRRGAILQYLDPGKYDFFHRTQMEYFAALKIKEEVEKILKTGIHDEFYVCNQLVKDNGAISFLIEIVNSNP
jgi:hypothetical protein